MQDSNAAMMSLVDISAPRREYYSVELDWRLPSQGGGLLFDDGKHDYRRLLRGGDFVSTFIACRFLFLLMRWLPRRFGGLAFIVSLYCGHLP